MATFTSPMENGFEELCEAFDYLTLQQDSEYIGYAATQGDTLYLFHLQSSHRRYASLIFAEVLSKLAIKTVFVSTQDPLLIALASEWKYDKTNYSCMFTEGIVAIPAAEPPGSIQLAEISDIPRIHALAGDFFDAATNGYTGLTERISAGTIYLLVSTVGEIMSIGLYERSLFCPQAAAMGIFTNPVHRQKGAATCMLLHLKTHIHSMGLLPVAGCLFHNHCSRRSLEAAGMVLTGVGFHARLPDKELSE